jgi:hypothetical protein
VNPARSLPESAVLFVNHHSERLIMPRLAPLVAAGFRTVVADNSGTFPSVEGTIVLPMQGNVGFAAACNAGVEALDQDVDVLVFLNPDVDADVEVLRQLAQEASTNADSGIVAPAEQVGWVIRENGYRYPATLREPVLAVRHMRSVRSHARSCPTGSSARRWRGRGRRFAGAGCIALARSRFASVGGFDERYFLYGEDLDLWHRLALAGAVNRFRPDLVVRHHMGTGSPVGAAPREILRWLGVELFAETFLPGRWPMFRLAHRPFLAMFQGEAGDLGHRVGVLWREGLPPSDVLARLRGFLVTGGMRANVNRSEG